MHTIKKLILASWAAALLVFLNCCASAPKEKAPVQVGMTQYKGQTIPVFDMSTVKYDLPPMLGRDDRRVYHNYTLERWGGSAGAHLMVIIGESGTPVEFGIIDSTTPQVGSFALSLLKNYHFYPLKDEAGKPILHALKKTLEPYEVIIGSTSVNRPAHPYLNHAGW